MKRIFVACLLVGSLSACSTGEQVVLADGSRTQMSHWEGRFLVINYWAEWCAPCRHEIPQFNDLHDSRVAHGLVMLGVNYDNLEGDKLMGVIDRMEIEFPVLATDPQQRYGYDRPLTLPTTVIISPERDVHEVLIGPQTSASILAALP